MATISNELFLYVCVKHANGGKINFGEVAKECGIKSNAAYMRWSRFTSKLDTSALVNASDNAGGNDDDDGGVGVGTPKKTPKKTAPKKSTPKKRKIGEDGDDEETKVKAEEE